MWESGADGADAKRERPGGRVVIAVVAALVLLVSGGYAAAYAVAGDKVPRGTSISGVDVGGLTRAKAMSTLEAAFEDRADAPIEVSVEASGSTPRTATVRPEEIGLSVDYAASVDEAGAGESWSPGRQWDYFTSGGDVDAVVVIDEQRLDAKLDELSEGLGTPPQDGRVTFTSDGVETAEAVRGEEIDRDAARDAIIGAYLGEDAEVELTVAPAEPEIDDSDVAEAAEGFANPAMADPVDLVFGKNRIRLKPAQYFRALAMEPENGELVPVIDEAVLTRLVNGATTDGKPVDATVRLVNGKPRVIPAKPGVSFDPAEVASVFERLLTAPPGSRRGTVKAKVVEAAFTTKDARALKIVEKVSEFKTFYPHADYRNVNIGRAAELIDGTVVKPGERFSLNETVGERTAENGFTEGYIISNGILRKDLGGGVSQLATTTFNAMFFAGLKDIEHKPHSFYIDRYPVGREATVAWPTVDLEFENDTPYGVLIRAWVEPSSFDRQGVVTVQMWSTKYWDIDTTTSRRYAYVPPKTRTLTTPDCEPHSGWSGFQVDVTRIFRRHGDSEVVKTEKFHTVYTPSDTVKCESPDPPPAEAGEEPDPAE
ncbi:MULTISPECIES: VanW family protein [Nocardioides]|uniref:VanW family protein n=1 Tax=Nocardioides vastitatis TaxID=2568655 RepID=A0ABW0ZGW3_9ACTN|nr:VanW family protein [Nocardioides sp.]